MPNIKLPSVAGMFYPSDTKAQDEEIKSYKETIKNNYEYKTRAVIAPHAGHIYSGKLAYESISCLDKNLKTVFIFAPAHRMYVDGSALADFEAFKIPYGDIRVNTEYNRILNEKFNLNFNNEAFNNEHSIEVQLPFLYKHLNDFKIVPILVGKENAETITNIINYFWANKENGFLISSDLSHFYKSQDAKKIDLMAANMIEQLDTTYYHSELACGSTSILGLINFAKENNFSLIRIGLYNSGDITGDKEKVVGYGSWILYENEKNHFIKTYYKNYTLEVAKQSIETKGKIAVNNNVPEVFKELGACFVTLELNNNLRGCIGSIVAHKPLVEDLISNAYSSAYKDPRFSPVTQDELDKLDIKVSLLSPPSKINFGNEKELLNQIVPYKDGIIIKDGPYQAVYLPSVWNELNDKQIFLDSLKRKAGMPPNHFSKTFEAFRFHTEYL